MMRICPRLVESVRDSLHQHASFCNSTYLKTRVDECQLCLRAFLRVDQVCCSLNTERLPVPRETCQHDFNFKIFQNGLLELSARGSRVRTDDRVPPMNVTWSALRSSLATWQRTSGELNVTQALRVYGHCRSQAQISFFLLIAGGTKRWQ